MPADMAVVRLLLVGLDANGVAGLWETNGAAAGTQELTRPGP
jgi:hypothetical protein